MTTINLNLCVHSTCI